MTALLVPTELAARPTVFVGGTIGSPSLAVASRTTQLRGTGRAGVYIHELGSEILEKAGVAKQVSALFDPVSVAEFGLPSRDENYNHIDAVNFFIDVFPRLYLNVGFHPDAANINGLDPTGVKNTISDWSDYKAIAARSGISSLAAFADPNGTNWPLDFADPFWNNYKEISITLGGVAIDSPPGYFWTQPEGYRRHNLEKMQWAHKHHLRVSFVISPWGVPNDFLKDSKRLITYLLEKTTLPTEWIVETYDNPAHPAHPENQLGSETSPITVDSVALWIALHGPVWQSGDSINQ